MANIQVPTRENVNARNQQIFDQLEDKLGFVPNLYATFALSENALGSYLGFAGAKSSLKAKEKEIVNLVVSQYNDCAYCLAAHTAIAGMNGFTPEQILEIRRGTASFNAKYDALARLVRSAVEGKSKPSPAAVDAFLAAGWTQENLVDVAVNIGEKTVSNYLHGFTQIPVDFPAAPALDAEPALA